MNFLINNTILEGFSGRLNETDIRIPEGITTIRYYTFSGWDTLQSVELPSTLNNIEYGVFDSCESLQEITLPDNLEYIGHMCFLQCTSLKKITIPEKVKHIGYGAFAECSALEEIQVSEKNPYFTSIDGVLYNKHVTELYCCPAGKKIIHIPETVQIIRKFAFMGCRLLNEVSIPESVFNIQSGAFSHCNNLREILIPASVTQCEDPEFIPDTLVHVQGKSGVMTYQPSETSWAKASILVLEKDFSIFMDGKHKYDLVFRMLFAGIAGADAYVKKHFAKMFRFLIDHDDIQKINQILNMQIFVSKRNIKTFVRYADEHSHPECWELLYHYQSTL